MVLSVQKVTVKNKNRFLPTLIHANKSNKDNRANNKNRNQQKKTQLQKIKNLKNHAQKTKIETPTP